MKMSSWFAHYGLTGTLLIIAQVAVLLITFDKADILKFAEDFGKGITPVFNTFPESIRYVVQSLAVAFGLALVFLFGLLLDLFSSYFVIWELHKFKMHLKYNRLWLGALVKRHEVYVSDDYDRIITQFGKLWNWDGLKIYIFWKPAKMKEGWKSFLTGWRKYKLLVPYGRLQSFLSAFVMVFSGTSNTEILTHHMLLWRASRAVSTTLFLFAVEFLYFSLFFSLRAPLIIQLIYIGLCILSALITLAAYSRFLYTLFGLAYATYCRIEQAA